LTRWSLPGARSILPPFLDAGDCGLRFVLPVLVVCWAAAFVGSFLAFWLTASGSVGLDAALSRVGSFLGWQAFALVLAVVCIGFRWKTTDPKRRMLAAVPAMGTGVMMIAMVGLTFWANLRHQQASPTPPPGPVTAPAVDLPTTAPASGPAVTE
jgi:hypothetical protein